MARRIKAHITIAYEVPDDGCIEVVRDQIAGNSPITVRLTSVGCWDSPEGGIYLGVADCEGGIARIREALHPADDAGAYVPHLTLVHPRSVSPSRAREAWCQLADLRIDADVLIDRLVVIESHDSQWQAVTTIRLHGR